jgi:hypothetical protein
MGRKVLNKGRVLDTGTLYEYDFGGQVWRAACVFSTAGLHY